MRIVQRRHQARRRTRASKWCRGAIGIGVLSALSVAAVASPGWRRWAATTTTTAPDGATTTTRPSARNHADRPPLPRAKVARTSKSATLVCRRTANTTPAPISGTGSSFASPAIETWVNTVDGAPYNLSVNWAPSNSGTGRYEFTNQTTDFAVSDIGYVGNTDTTPPSFPFNFIPITAGGIAFMYNVPGLTQAAPAQQPHGVRPADRGHQELERSEHRRGQSRA